MPKWQYLQKTLSDEQSILNVVAYISTLSSSKPATTESGGNPTKGEETYRELACALCHGLRGQGFKKSQIKYDYEVPRISDQHDWYLTGQINKFKAKLRGYDVNDKGGVRIRLETIELDTDQKIKDLVAYIGTLE